MKHLICSKSMSVTMTKDIIEPPSLTILGDLDEALPFYETFTKELESKNSKNKSIDASLYNSGSVEPLDVGFDTFLVHGIIGRHNIITGKPDWGRNLDLRRAECRLTKFEINILSDYISSSASPKLEDAMPYFSAVVNTFNSLPKDSRPEFIMLGLGKKVTQKLNQSEYEDPDSSLLIDVVSTFFDNCATASPARYVPQGIIRYYGSHNVNTSSSAPRRGLISLIPAENYAAQEVRRSSDAQSLSSFPMPSAHAPAQNFEEDPLVTHVNAYYLNPLETTFYNSNAARVQFFAKENLELSNVSFLFSKYQD